MDLKVGDYVMLKRDNGGVQRITPSMEFDGVRKVKKVIASNVFVLEYDTREFWYERRSLYKVTEINDLKEKNDEFRQFVYDQLTGISTHGEIMGWCCGRIASIPKKRKYKMHYKEVKKEKIIEFLRKNDKARANIMNRLMKEDREEVE